MSVKMGYWQEWAAYRNAATCAQSNTVNTVTTNYAYTHLSFAFMSIKNNALAFGSADVQTHFETNFMANAATDGVCRMISVGGAGSGSTAFKGMASTSASRQTFITSVVAFLKQWKLVGIDIDWEYPALADKASFTALMAELRTALGTSFLLTAAIPASRWQYEQGDAQGIDLTRVSASVDWWNVMTYDIGMWACTPNTRTAPHTGLPDIRTFIDYLLTKAPASKVVLGLAAYGYSCKLQPGCAAGTSGYGCLISGPAEVGSCTGDGATKAYFELEAKAAAGAVRVADAQTTTTTLRASGNYWATYDTKSDLNAKIAYASGKSARGWMIWAADMIPGGL